METVFSKFKLSKEFINLEDTCCCKTLKYYVPRNQISSVTQDKSFDCVECCKCCIYSTVSFVGCPFCYNAYVSGKKANICCNDQINIQTSGKSFVSTMPPDKSNEIISWFYHPDFYVHQNTSEMIPMRMNMH